jgi:hypothetical protein
MIDNLFAPFDGKAFNFMHVVHERKENDDGCGGGVCLLIFVQLNFVSFQHACGVWRQRGSGFGIAVNIEREKGN